ncbi:MAG: SpoIIE family protein phosphatase [Bacteroidetes bacterium]|nr:SpoIIE family protein phosphatase [Bacteroidota bacterium]
MEKAKELYLKNISKIIIAVSVIFILTAIIELYFSLAVNIQSNDECLWVQKEISQDSSAIVFESVKVGGVTWNAGIRNDDELLEINNQPFSNPSGAQLILNKVQSGQYADYTIKKAGKIIHTKVYVKKLIQVGSVANILLALMQMLIGFIVLMSKPNGRVQKLFYGIGIALVLGSVGMFIPNTITPKLILQNPYPYAAAILLGSLGVCSSPFLFLSLFWTFPKPFKFMERKWVRRLLFIIPVVLALLFFAAIVKLTREGNFAGISPLNKYLGIMSSVLEITAFISLVINYRRLKTKEEKKPILIILIAFAIAIIAVLYTATIAPIISDTIFNSPQYYTPIILIILVPIGFAYSIFKYQLMDVSVVIKNTLMYGTATVALAAIYFLIIYVLGTSISAAIGTQFQTIIAGSIFIVFALVFQSTKDKFQDFLTARFYPEQFAYQKVLLRFSNDISTLVGLDNILDSMKSTFVEALKINRFGILIRGKKDEEFHLIRNVGIVHEDLIINSGSLQQVIERKSLISEKVVIEQNEFAAAFPEISNQLIEEGIFTIIPLMIKSKIIGLLLFGLKHSGSQFAGKDLELLNATANQAAISIENARLYESEAEKLKMERDLSLARRIQQGLLPKCIPNISGLDICGEMIPAMQVGGDYYDLIPVSDTKLFVVVGDVSGKGLSASLYMTKLQTMIQFSCSSDKSPKEILIELNKKFYDSIERNSFVTITLALFDTEKRIVTFCRAGHMPLLIATNGSIHSYRTQGIGVGLEKGIIFEKTLIEEEVPLNSGQIYAFFSDGITEAMNNNLDLFGEEKLSDILKNKTQKTSNEIMSEIWRSLNNFRGDAEQNDDMTMVIVKVA